MDRLASSASRVSPRVALAVGALTWAIAGGAAAEESAPVTGAPETPACGLHKWQGAERYEHAKNNLFVTFNDGARITLQNFSNGGAGIILITEPADPSYLFAHPKC
jgi:hypothetical protein